jgi:hypothetical protein
MKRYWENLRPFEKRVVAGVATMLFVIFNLWFVWPHFSDLAKMKDRMEEAQKNLKIRQTAISQMAVYDAEINKVKHEGRDVPADDQVQQFSLAISDEMVRSGVTPQSSGKPIPRTNQFFVEQSQTITVQSGEQQLVDFLFNLGSGTSLIRVRDLGLHPDAPHQQLAATIRLAESFQKTTTTKAPTPAGKTSSTKLAGAPMAPERSPIVNPAPQPGKKTAK